MVGHRVAVPACCKGAHMCLGPLHVLALLWMARYGHPCRADTPCWITSSRAHIAEPRLDCRARTPRTHTAHAHHPRHDKLDVQQRTWQGRVPAPPPDSAAMRCIHPSHRARLNLLGRGQVFVALLQLVNFITMLSRGSESLRFLDIPG